MMLLEYALKYYDAGLNVFPVNHKNKAPLLPRGHKLFEQRASREQVIQWFSNESVKAIGCATGVTSGNLAVIDFDAPELYPKWREIIADGLNLALLPVQKTGRNGGGFQVFLRCEKLIRNKKLAHIHVTPSDKYPKGKMCGIETRGQGGYVVVPPSDHPDGNKYAWMDDSSRTCHAVTPEQLDIAINGAESLDEFPEDVPVEMEKAIAEGPKQPREGANVIETYNAQHSVVDLLLGQGYTQKGRMLCRPGAPDRHSVWIHEGKSFHHSTNDPLYSEHLRDAFDLYTAFEHGGDVKSAVKSAAQKLGLDIPKNTSPFGPDGTDYSETPKSAGKEVFELTDTGNARRLAAVCGRDVMYNEVPFKTWFHWDGSRWASDASKLIYAKLNMVYRDIVAEAKDATGERREGLLKMAVKMQGANTMKNIVFAATCNQELAFSAESLDKNPLLFNVQNGTIDLESGEAVLTPHDPENRITKLSPVEYRAGADCPKWKAFLNEIFDNDEELITYIKRAVGYSLTGSLSEQCLFFAYGLGANGKSIFFGTIEKMLGDYAGKVPAEMLMMQKNNPIPSDVATMQGKRFVIASEIEQGGRLAESRVKDLTGGDTVSARKMYQDWFSFTPTHKLWIYGNHKPDIRGEDNGIWRRMRLIPFTVTIPEDKRLPDTVLFASFKAEESGILNWMLEGYREYTEQGMPLPMAVIRAIKEYRSESDIIGSFIEELCVPIRSESVTLKSVVEAFRTWATETGEREVSSRKLSKSLRERGYEIVRKTENKQYIQGLMLK